MQRELWSPSPAEFPFPRLACILHNPSSGDSALPGSGPLSKFFWAVKREVKISSEPFRPQLFSA